jgi:hypothetical protein
MYNDEWSKEYLILCEWSAKCCKPKPMRVIGFEELEVDQKRDENDEEVLAFVLTSPMFEVRVL